MTVKVGSLVGGSAAATVSARTVDLAELAGSEARFGRYDRPPLVPVWCQFLSGKGPFGRFQAALARAPESASVGH